jgi:hypothetical protein
MVAHHRNDLQTFAEQAFPTETAVTLTGIFFTDRVCSEKYAMTV